MENNNLIPSNFSLIEIKNGWVDARGLYKFLQSKRQFANWINDKLLDFEEGFDFNKIVKPLENNKKDYMLSVDCAKELAMMERTEVGKIARRYFIEMEKKS